MSGAVLTEGHDGILQITVARELADIVAANGPLAVQAAKTVMWESLAWPLAEGALAFTEKRSPVWSGR